jgi:adenylosuccinate synthase
MKKLLHDLGSVSAIIGAQWGDEGKGKVTDILGSSFDVIARACGGANAGHTIVVDGKKHVFRLLPSGCLHEGRPVILGSGMVIHLSTLLEEIEILTAAGISIVERLFISPAAHIVFEYHKAIDVMLEEKRATGIGTTKRGIGPCYMDKAARSGIRMEQIVHGDIKALLGERAKALRDQYDIIIDMQAELSAVDEAKKIIGSRIVPSLTELLRSYVHEKKSILIEGAQATLLDIDHGTYPYVTSSSTTASGALQGLGLPPNILNSCIGVLKAYCTRVGSGDFLTEETGETGERLRERGGEYGSVTGRPRRCGWIYLPDIAYASFINGFSCINMTKLDVLDMEGEVRVGMKKGSDGKVIYENMKGWKTSTAGIREWKDLPKEAQNYVSMIEKFAGVSIRMIGTGQAREDMIIR